MTFIYPRIQLLCANISKVQSVHQLTGCKVKNFWASVNKCVLCLFFQLTYLHIILIQDQTLVNKVIKLF